MSYKTPNIKGPKIIRKTVSVVSHKEMTEFRRMYPEHKDLTLTKFNQVLKRFHENVIEEVINEPNGIGLPERIGRLIIVSFPTRRDRVIDFNESNKVGRKVYRSNWNTDNRICKIVFHKEKRIIINHEFWTFKASQNFRRKVSQAFLKFWPRYMFVGPLEDVSQILRLRK